MNVYHSMSFLKYIQICKEFAWTQNKIEETLYQLDILYILYHQTIFSMLGMGYVILNSCQKDFQPTHPHTHGKASQTVTKAIGFPQQFEGKTI